MNLKELLTLVWNNLPVLKPLFTWLLSRKGVIAAAIVGLMVQQLPELAEISDPLIAVIAFFVSTAIVGAANIIGIALEDSAAIKAGTHPNQQ